MPLANELMPARALLCPPRTTWRTSTSPQRHESSTAVQHLVAGASPPLPACSPLLIGVCSEPRRCRIYRRPCSEPCRAAMSAGGRGTSHSFAFISGEGEELVPHLEPRRHARAHLRQGAPHLQPWRARRGERRTATAMEHWRSSTVCIGGAPTRTRWSSAGPADVARRLRRSMHGSRQKLTGEMSTDGAATRKRRRSSRGRRAPAELNERGGR